MSDVARGWVRGLTECGVKTVDFNYDDVLNFYDGAHDARGNKSFPDVDDVVRLSVKSLAAQVYEWWPDLVLIVYGAYMPSDYYEVLRSRGHTVVLAHTESPYQDDEQLEAAHLADINLVNDPTNLDKFRAINPRTFYVPHAYDPEIHTPDGPLTDPHDFCFVGTGFPSREQFFTQVDFSGIDVAFAGNWRDSELTGFLVHPENECVENTEAVRLYRSSKASANLYREHFGWAMGPREVELAATGCFYLTEPRGENREVLPMVPTFTEPGEFGDKLRWWLTHDDERVEVARAARAAIAPRTFANHARQLLEAL